MKYFFISTLLIISGCVSINNSPYESELPGRYHRVQKGDTLELVAKKYQVSVDEIMDINGIDNPRALRLGQALFVPDADPIANTIKNLKKRVHAKTPVAKQAPVVSPNNDDRPMIFPVVHGTVFHEFSRVKKDPYDGLGIKAARGEKVLSALDGSVIFVGDDGTKFGLIVIVEHEAPYITVYTHLDRALVKVGHKLKQGEALGLVGTSGGVSSPRLHFQVRVQQRPKDPRLFLRTQT